MGKEVNITPPRLALYEILRFWQTVDRTLGQGPNGDCWEWQGLREPTGYGHLFLGSPFEKNRHLKTHRYAFYLANEYWPHGHVCHLCDNPPCCNPSHLVEGTPIYNIDDKVAKGRQPRGDTHWMITQPERVPKGSQRSQTKLNETMIIEIRKRVASGETQKAIAKEKGVSKSLISRVITGMNWTHV